MEKLRPFTSQINYIFFFLFCTVSVPIFAQNTQTIVVDLAQKAQHREKLFPTSNQADLELCGLLIGQTYSLNYVS